MSVREEVLDEAKQYVSNDRQSTYDAPENNFGRIAAIANAMGYTRRSNALKPEDVALFMLAVKLARLSHTPNHRDSWVDTAGYAACGYDCVVATAEDPVTPPSTVENGALHIHNTTQDGETLKEAAGKYLMPLGHEFVANQDSPRFLSDLRCTFVVHASPGKGISTCNRSRQAHTLGAKV